jgi:hypothetical protein
MGYWLWVMGYLLVVIGYWLLVMGYWLLEKNSPFDFAQGTANNK